MNEENHKLCPQPTPAVGDPEVIGFLGKLDTLLRKGQLPDACALVKSRDASLAEARETLIKDLQARLSTCRHILHQVDEATASEWQSQASRRAWVQTQIELLNTQP